MCAGMTGCGKSQFARRLLLSDKIQPEPAEIYWCYGEAQSSLFQELAAEMQEEKPHQKLYFVEGFSDEVQQRIAQEPEISKLLILDDLMVTAGSCKNVAKMFVQGSHHKNCSVLYIVQNLFDKGSQARTISLNCHYIVVFKNPRDRSQIMSLSRQMFPGDAHVLTDAFSDATTRPYGYICLNLRATTNDCCRLQTNILPDESPTVVYVPTQRTCGL